MIRIDDEDCVALAMPDWADVRLAGALAADYLWDFPRRKSR
jgi:hypothetical protein